MKKIFIFSLLIISFTQLSAQDSITYKVPHQLSFEGGYRYVLSVIDRSAVPFTNNASHGYGFLFDYAWKVSGFTKDKPNIFLSVPIGYTVMLPDDPASQSTSMLNYGWTVRHEIGKNNKIVPFTGYGLLLNTLKKKGTDGGVMGHQTQFEFGANMNTSSKLKYFAKIQYSYNSFPKLGDSKRIHFQYLDLRVGVRF